jgi:coenzyme F420-reducing hydrogenase beta subunit
MKEVAYQSVCEVIVPADMCIGCGICAAICPVSVLEMRFNEYGEYVPVEVRPGCIPCPICLQGCPFWNQDDNEDSLAELAFGHERGVQHRFETGYYLKSFVGYVGDNAYRVSRSSGGLATWLQQTYLEEGLADFALSVVPNDDPNQLFRFAVLDTVDKVRYSARSAYYPVELSGVIEKVLKTPGRYIMTGLPCFIKGLRLAMRRNSKLRKRIVCTIGLVCGQAKSKFFAEHLIAVSGGELVRTKQVDFRHKDPARSAIEYAFAFEYDSNDGAESRMVTCSPEISRQTWGRDYFKPNACDYCDDVFAEVADVVCMDAWLPEYSKDWRGHSIAIVRSPQVLAVIKRGIEKGTLAVEEIEIEQVIKSQRGVLANKREKLAHRLSLNMQQARAYVPQKRVKPQKLSSPIDRWLCSLQEQMRVLSRQRFADLGDHRDAEHINWFHSEMSQAVFLYSAVQFIDRLIRRLPRRIIRLTRRLHGLGGYHAESS